MNLDIRHDSAKERFYARVQGQYCVVDYKLDGDVMVIRHTSVPPPVSGRGIAAALTEAALAFARSKGLKVRPVCSYADHYLRTHAEFADLRVASSMNG